MESHRRTSIGYEFGAEQDARASASELDRRFTERELLGLRVYRIVWNGNFLVEATFSKDIEEPRLDTARAILGEAGSPVHEDDLEDYRKATRDPRKGGIGGWFRNLFR